jgi:molecular chaperone GrpE
VNEARQDNSSVEQPESGMQTSEGAGNDVGALRQALAAAEEATRAQRDLYVRALAELDNVRKRAQRDIENAHRYALEGFVNELLPVRDGLELAVRQGGQADVKILLEGQDATLKLLDRAFKKFSIETLNPLGKRFDPSQHEAVLMQPSDRADPDTVLQVVQPGYELKGRLLRPARVIVAKASDG